MLLSLIREATPEWFRTTGATPSTLLGDSTLELEGGVGVIRASLSIEDCAGTVTVREQIPGTRFPATCHERHIQSDHCFCIGLDAGKNVSNHDQAAVWWGLLERFLRLQRVAERTRKWPAQQEIAHGDAGPHQLAAFEAAQTLGMADQYLRMLTGESAWFSSAWPKLDPQGRLRNGRARCPAGCTRKKKPILRTDCCKSDAVVTLLREERLRQEKIQKFWKNVKDRGEKCCGTMLNCPLKSENGYIRDVTRSGGTCPDTRRSEVALNGKE